MKCDPLLDIINQINNKDIREFVMAVLNSVDDSFYTMSASSSNKYHPAECNGEGGLVRHVQRACYFGKLFIDSQKWDADNVRADILLASILLHDIGKKEKYAEYREYYNHPIVGAKMLESFKGMIHPKYFQLIQDCVKCHMSIWGPKSVQKENYTVLETFTYLADFLASKKDIVIDPTAK